MKRLVVKFLERPSEFADVVGGTAFNPPDLAFRYPFGTEDAAKILQQRVAVLEVYEGAVKGAV